MRTSKRREKGKPHKIKVADGRSNDIKELSIIKTTDGWLGRQLGVGAFAV